MDPFHELEKKISKCRKCPRLVDFRENIPKRAQYKDHEYWRKPVSGFGDPKAWLLILGLAPSAHGGNRTGRIFTGDPSARFLMKALYKTGLANQDSSEEKDDGLVLKGCFMTPIVKCVPPQNRPTRQECRHCEPYLQSELNLLKHTKAILALGKLAFDAAARMTNVKMQFTHGCKCKIKNLFTLYGCYHPSPQNTYTGKLTLPMLVSLLKKIILSTN